MIERDFNMSFDMSCFLSTMDHVKLGELLENHESHIDHNETGNGDRDGYKNDVDLAISNQATEGTGSVEGSETRSVSPNNNLTHERPTSFNDDDIVRTSVKAEEDGIKSPSTTCTTWSKSKAWGSSVPEGCPTDSAPDVFLV